MGKSVKTGCRCPVHVLAGARIKARAGAAQTLRGMEGLGLPFMAGRNWQWQGDGLPWQRQASFAGANSGFPACFINGSFCSFSRSKFKALKTPPSHGLAGLGAIKTVAK